MIHAKVMMMKISKSKRQLAQLLIDAGVKEFPNGADWAAQGSTDLKASFYSGYMPNRGFGEDAFCGNYCGRCHDVQLPSLINNWYQTVLSRDEFNQIVAEIVADAVRDADGWIEWKGGECPVDVDALVCCKLRSGRVSITPYHAGILSWRHNGNAADIIAYRLHKPEQVKPGFCESVVRSIPEPEKIKELAEIMGCNEDIDVIISVAKSNEDWIKSLISRPSSMDGSIEQLAANYRNLLDFARRKQQEADDAKADAYDKLKALELAGEAIGLIVSPIAEKQKSELVIAVQVGDEVECVESNIRRNRYNGMVGRLRTIDESDTSTPYLVDFGGEVNIWCHKVKFIRRP